VVAHDGDAAAWNAFVESRPDATVFHLAEWGDVIRSAYGHQPRYLVAGSAGGVRGVLPLVLVRSRLFGRALVSLPFCDYGGVCGDAEAAAALLDEALRIGRAAGADYVQVRHREPVEGVAGTAGDKVTMVLPLDPDPAVIWGRLPSERRNRVKKAGRQGLAGRVLESGGLEAFYRVWAENMRDIGSPVHGLAFFRAIETALGKRMKVLLVERAGEAIGAAVCLCFGEEIAIPWVSSLRRHFEANPNMVLYWTAIEYACLHGYRRLDFGRSSPGTGTFEFKRQWGATPQALAWRSFPLRSGAVPTFSGGGLRERLFVEGWKRLPLSLTVWLGPRLRRSIPA
jgi:FemAB-related protein (PEP-CTERM system-associated)